MRIPITQESFESGALKIGEDVRVYDKNGCHYFTSTLARIDTELAVVSVRIWKKHCGCSAITGEVFILFAMGYTAEIVRTRAKLIGGVMMRVREL